MAHPSAPPSTTRSFAPPTAPPARTLAAPAQAAPSPRTATEVAFAAAACTFDDALNAVDGARLLQAALAALPNQTYARALVAPCGGAAMASALGAQRVVAIDASRPLLAKAQRRLAQRPDRARFHLWHGALAELPSPVAGHAFDLVVVDLARDGVAGHAPAALRLAVHEQLALGGVLLAIERCAHGAGATRAPIDFAYTLLHAQTLQLGGVDFTLRCYWR